MNTSLFTVITHFHDQVGKAVTILTPFSFSLLFGQLQMFQEGKISCRHGIAIHQRIMFLKQIS